MLKIEPRHLKIVQSVLAKYPYKFYAFGSRVNGNPRKLSDLDICFFDDIPYNTRQHIVDDFDESDLPYKVDIIDWNSTDNIFQNKIKDDLIIISP
jgi:predicted nucleotidyltransferase